MGSSSSSPMADAETHGQAFSKTTDTRQIMDQLLNYMIKQLSIRDLLHMSNPSECKKYVLFKANSIYQYFYELRIIPGKDAKGVLTFRKADDLINPKGEKKDEQDKERQSLCLIVAYFYTRIFQIYGALALTVIDDMTEMTSNGIMSLPSISNNRLYAPGYSSQQFYQGKGGVKSDGLFGSEIRMRTSNSPKQPLKNFEWIRNFLLPNEYIPSIGFKTIYQGTSSLDRGDVYIKIEDDQKDQKGRSVTYQIPPPSDTVQDGAFFIRMIDTDATLDIDTRIVPGMIKVKIDNLKVINKSGDDINVSKFERVIVIENKPVDGIMTYFVKNTNDTITNYLLKYFSEIIKYIKDKKKVHNNTDSSGSTISTGQRSEDNITEHLRVEKIINNLSKRKPLGHCIARALQLLKTEPLPNQPGISRICSATFAQNKHAGVVKRGEPLSDSPGLFALANLFYDTITMGSKNLTIGKTTEDGKSSMDQYIEFMKKLSEQYDPGTTHTSEEYEKKGLTGISNKRDTDLCPTTTDIPLSPDATTKVHAIVKTMFQEQVRHAAECYQIISMLFDITKDKATQKPIFIKLHPNLITKGFPELNRINHKARDLLIKYYTNCENKYISGMTIVLDEQKTQKAKVEAEARAVQARAVQARAAAPVAAAPVAAPVAAAAPSAPVAAPVAAAPVAAPVAATLPRTSTATIANVSRRIQKPRTATQRRIARTLNVTAKNTNAPMPRVPLPLQKQNSTELPARVPRRENSIFPFLKNRQE